MSLRNKRFLFALLVALSQSSCWAATHDELPQCGTTGVYKTRQTVIQSPSYPDNYSPNTCLDYVIRSPYRCPTKFHIQFLDFQLESSVNCTKDYLAIGLQSDGDDMDLLCGEVVGIKKYHTLDGVLLLRFFADDSPWTTAKGFKLLITRLACEREELLRANIDANDDDTEEVSAPAAQLSTPHDTLPAIFRNLSLQDQHVSYPLPPLFGLNYPNPLLNYPSPPPPPTGFGGIYVPITPSTQLSQQPAFQVPSNEKPCAPTQTPLTHLPQFYQSGTGSPAIQKQQLPLIADQYTNWQNQAIESKSSTPTTVSAQTRQQINSPFLATTSESCCASSFLQKRFYLSSPGFPRTAFTSLLPTQQRDCQFQLEKFSQSVCRLRVEFKFFDFGQTYSGTGAKQGNIEVAIGTSKDVCTEDFIQIDDERFCGCRTGYVYNSFWGLGKKSIRMRIGYSGIPSSGFLLDIFQEDCTGLQYVPAHLPGAQNLSPGQQSGLGGTPNIGLVQPNGLAQQTNGFTNLGQQQNSLNFLGINGQQSLVGNQQQASLVPQQIYPIYQQNSQQYNPQNVPFWMPPQQQLPLVYPMPQFRSARNANFARSGNTHQPVSVVETNSTRKEYYYLDGDEVFERARLSDEPDDPEKMVNTHYAALRGRCSFDAMDILRLSVDYNWIMKPTCYSPQGRWFSNLFG